MFLTESHPLWIVDSGATYHIAKDREAFVDFRRVPHGARWIYVENNVRVEVKGIGTCKLVMHGGRTFFLHDVLFSLEIRQNLVYVLVLLKFGFNLNFHATGVDLFLDSTFCGYVFFFYVYI